MTTGDYWPCPCGFQNNPRVHPSRCGSCGRSGENTPEGFVRALLGERDDEKRMDLVRAELDRQARLNFEQRLTRRKHIREWREKLEPAPALTGDWVMEVSAIGHTGPAEKMPLAEFRRGAFDIPMLNWSCIFCKTPHYSPKGLDQYTCVLCGAVQTGLFLDGKS